MVLRDKLEKMISLTFLRVLRRGGRSLSHIGGFRAARQVNEILPESLKRLIVGRDKFRKRISCRNRDSRNSNRTLKCKKN